MSVYKPTYRDGKTKKLKQSKIWWYSFIFAGRRIQESSKSTRKTIALAAEENRHRELERARVGLPSVEANDRIRRISETLSTYEKTYKINHREKSILMVKNRSAHLVRILGSLLLSDITQPRILDYMQQRQNEEAGGRTINLELQILASAMGYTWKVLWPRVKRLEENHDVGRALEPAEEQALLEAAAKSQSKLIHPFLYTLAWTGLRSDEARTLQWSQVSFEAAGEIIVGDSKTDAGRGRRIPMSAKLRAVLTQHASWYASRLGAIQPQWYVFPLSNRLAPVDPLKPVTSLKTAWETVRTTAKVKCRLHDLRHSFCTKLAEAGVPEGTMLDIMGHVSTVMLRRYSHIRAQARRDAMDSLESRQDSNGASKVSTKVVDSERPKVVLTH